MPKKKGKSGKEKLLRLPQHYEEMHRYASQHGLRAVKDMLRKWVRNGQGDELMPGFTSRAMCKAASSGLEGRSIDDVPVIYLQTKYGAELYFHMWGTDEG